MNSLADVLRSGKDLGLSVARGVPQLATGFVDLAAMPFTATGLIEPEDVFGSTDYLTRKGLLPPKQDGLDNETVELVSSALSPGGAAKAGILGLGTIGALGQKQISAWLRKGFSDEGPFRRVGSIRERKGTEGIQRNDGFDWGTGVNPSGIRGVIEDPSLRGGRGSDLRSRQESAAEVKKIIATPDQNLAVKIATDINPEFNTDFLKTMPPSSMVKQSPIAATVDQMTRGEIDPKLKAAIFSRYLREMPEIIRNSGATNYDELSQAAYERLAKETDEQFDSMLANDINLSFHRNGEGNYLDSREMLSDALLNNHLYTFQGGDPHTFLNAYDKNLGVNSNEKFRAVHDFFGHGTTGASFGPKGEELAYGAHGSMYSPLAKIAAATETRGQNSLVNYSGMNANLMAKMNQIRAKRAEAIRLGNPTDKFDESLRDLGSQWQYAPQTDFILPPEFLDINYGGQMPDYIRPFIRPENPISAPGYHWSKSDNLYQTDPKMYGTGIDGRESVRKSFPGWENRTYFYNNPSVKEQGLGPNQYETQLENMYDAAKDVRRFNSNARETLRDLKTMSVDNNAALNAFEKAVKDFGYNGYKVDNTSAVFNPQTVSKILRKGQK